MAHKNYKFCLPIDVVAAPVAVAIEITGGGVVFDTMMVEVAVVPVVVPIMQITVVVVILQSATVNGSSIDLVGSHSLGKLVEHRGGAGAGPCERREGEMNR